MRHKNFWALIFVIAFMTVSAGPAFSASWYIWAGNVADGVTKVKYYKDDSGGYNSQNWNQTGTESQNLQRFFDTNQSPGNTLVAGDTIYIASGTYKISGGNIIGSTTGFPVLQIYGGFNGETNSSDRDPFTIRQLLKI